MSEMEEPRTAGEVVQFIAAITWMIKGMPRLAEIKDELNELLEEVYAKTNGRKKNKCEKLDLHSHGMWKEKHSVVGQNVKPYKRRWKTPTS